MSPRRGAPRVGVEPDGMDRRRFLKGSVALGGAIALGNRFAALGQTNTPDVGPQLGDSLLTGAAADSPIDTIVVVCMENRSFDHYFGWLATDERYLEAGRSRYGSAFSTDGLQAQQFLRPDGSIATTYPLATHPGEANAFRGCGHPDPGHGWDNGRTQRDHGFVAAGSGNDDFAVGYYLEGDLPCYGQLARGATTFDRYFCSLLSSTYPNREYLHGAQSGGMTDNKIPYGKSGLGFPWATIWDKLRNAGVPATMYGTDLPTTLLWGPRLLPQTKPIAEYFAQAATGTLPNVVFVDPGVTSGMRTDDHPVGDMRMAQRFVASVVDAFQRSPQWGHGALIITYDEWGGFFDHVRPPVFADDRASTLDRENFGQAGFRLPVMLHSPYARPGYVDHRAYDHSSILRFIEWRFLGAPPEGPGGGDWWLTQRDRNAANIGASLANRRINDFVLDASAVPLVVSVPCAGEYFQDVPGAGDLEAKEVIPALARAGVTKADLDRLNTSVSVDPPALVEPSLEDLLLSGYAEDVGWDATPSMSLDQLLTGL